jgi:putative membrane protein
MHAKLAVVVLLLAHHFACGRLLGALAAGTDRHTHRWFRVFNEIPVFGLLAAVVLVVVKPF